MMKEKHDFRNYRNRSYSIWNWKKFIDIESKVVRLHKDLIYMMFYYRTIITSLKKGV